MLRESKLRKSTLTLHEQGLSRGQNYLKGVSNPPQASHARNAREGFQEVVESLVRQAAALTDELEDLRAFGFPVESFSVDAEIDFYEEVRRFEISMIKKALKVSQGSQKKAANLLKLKQTTLNTKIKSYQIS